MENRRKAGSLIRIPGAILSTAGLLALACAGCGRGEPDPVVDPGRLTMTLRSPAFADGGMIPKDFTCDGSDRSPPLEWSGVPAAARELVLILDDPDAPTGTFSHWVVVLPPRIKALKEGVPAGGVVPPPSMEGADDTRPEIVARQGKNDFGKLGYGGPCPPSGTHSYVFRIYALDSPIATAGDAPTRADAIKAIKGHILAEGRLTGKYARSR